jgi:hypothetical protein
MQQLPECSRSSPEEQGNQSLLNLIHACKSVDPDPQDQTQTQIQEEGGGGQGEAAATQQQALQLAERIYQRCVARGALPALLAAPPPLGASCLSVSIYLSPFLSLSLSPHPPLLVICLLLLLLSLRSRMKPEYHLIT